MISTFQNKSCGTVEFSPLPMQVNNTKENDNDS